MLGMDDIGRYLWVAAGGGVGAVGRVALQTVLSAYSIRFPWGTLAANTLGSMALGLLAGLWLHLPLQSPWRLFAMAGVMGGFTTFSSFSLENLQLLRSGRPWAALSYALISLFLGLGVTALGYAVGRIANRSF